MQINSINNTSFGKIYIEDNAKSKVIKEIMNSNASADVYKQALINMIATEDDDKMVLSAKLDDYGELRLNLINNHVGVTRSVFGPNGFMSLLKTMCPDSVKALIIRIKNGEE